MSTSCAAAEPVVELPEVAPDGPVSVLTSPVEVSFVPPTKVIFGAAIFLGGGFRIGPLLPLPAFLSPFSFMASLGSGGLIGVGSGMGLPSFWCSFTTYKRHSVSLTQSLC